MSTVMVQEGAIEGFQGKAGNIYLGIPYAQPPVGDLRFKAPQPPLKWQGTRAAKAFGCRPWQMVQTGFYEKEFFSNPEYMPPMSEDCLYLNIWTPAKSAGEKLPVAFWIHGGAFINGFGSEMEFDGDAFAQRGVILVTINYRLGAFGFFASEELTAENAGIVGNMAILDQIAALRWVRDNIASFGGDPQRITIFGQSAGSISVQTLLSSPLAAGLFSGAILQSGGGYKDLLKRDLLPTEAYTSGGKLMQLSGAANLAELRALPAENIMAAAAQLFAEMVGLNLPFYPVLDGHVLVNGYNAAIEQGLLHPAHIMIGSTLDDLRRPNTPRPSIDPFNQSCVDFSHWLEKNGRDPAYVYHFGQEPQGDSAGAFHSSELWYVFGTLDRSWRPKTDADYRVSAAMSDYWTNFVKTGNPNGENLPQWARCSAAAPHIQRLDEAFL